MEPIRRRPQDVTPGRSLPGRPTMPASHRPVFNDFTSRPPARPIAQPARPLGTPAPVTPQTAPPLPHPPGQPAPSLQPAAPRPQQQMPHFNPVPAQPATPLRQPTAAQSLSHTATAPLAQPKPPQTPKAISPAAIDIPAASISGQPASRPFAAATKAPEHRSHTSRAGLVGFASFILLAGLLLSPFLPSKTFDSFPGSSQSSLSGDDSLACIHELQQTSTTTSYDHKLGSPITYSYATTTTQKATCDDKPLTAIAGHTGQFNPLGLLIDALLAIIVAIVVTKIWRRIFDKQD